MEGCSRTANRPSTEIRATRRFWLTGAFAWCEPLGMELSLYLKSHNVSLTALAQAIGVRVTTLHGYKDGRRKPPPKVIAAIEKYTDGAVRAADFVAPDDCGPEDAA